MKLTHIVLDRIDQLEGLSANPPMEEIQDTKKILHTRCLNNLKSAILNRKFVC